MYKLILILFFLATPLYSATMTDERVPWHGPGGSHGCDGDCGLEWALGTLPESAPRKQIEQAIEANPEGVPIYVVSGDELVMMSYANDGTPYADLRGGVAYLDAPEPATGWVVQSNGETWIFAKVVGCQNWTLIRQADIMSSSQPVTMDSFFPVFPNPPTLTAGPPTLISHPKTVRKPRAPGVPSNNGGIASVPLPGSVWLIALALAALLASGTRNEVWLKPSSRYS